MFFKLIDYINGGERRQMKTIGFNGSPRIHGNTAWTIGKILDAAKEQGAKIELFHSGNLDIKPCKGCLGCVEGDRCIMNDDMQKLYTALKEADSLVLGAPIYMGQMSAQAKIFTDRLFVQITPRFSPRFKEENAGKKLVLVFTQGNPDAGKFRIYIGLYGLHVRAAVRRAGCGRRCRNAKRTSTRAERLVD
jgi:multimeric flavodoxin WrbA